MLGIGTAQGLQGVPHIGRAGQVELVVGSHKSRLDFQRLLHHKEAFAVVEQCVVDLERVLWRYNKPYLIERGLREEAARQSYMPVVNGIEGTAVDTDGPPLSPQGGMAGLWSEASLPPGGGWLDDRGLWSVECHANHICWFFPPWGIRGAGRPRIPLQSQVFLVLLSPNHRSQRCGRTCRRSPVQTPRGLCGR